MREQVTKVHVRWAWIVRAFLHTWLLGGARLTEKQPEQFRLFLFTFMKHNLLLLLLAMILPTATFAEDGDIFTAETIEGVSMKFQILSESGKTCEVYGKTFTPSISSSTTGNITIPDTPNEIGRAHV